MSASTDDVLARASRGEASFGEMARALGEIEQLTILLRPGDMRRYLGDLDAAMKEKGIGNVTVRDAEAPRQVGIMTKDGFVPQVFTCDQLAREFAVSTGLIEPDAAMAMTMARPVDVLHDCLARGWPGVVVDDQSPRKINMHRPTVARLYALLTRDEFAASHELHAVIHEGETLYQRPEKGPGRHAFVFDSPEAAAAGLVRLGERGSAVGARPTPTAALLESLLRDGVTLLMVNPGLPTARHYDRDDLVAMISTAGGDTAAANDSPGADDGAPPTDPALEPRTAVDGTPPARPALAAPPPGRDEADAREAFLALHRRAEERSIGIWEYVEALAFDVDYHVPIHPERVDGHRWPMLWRHPDDPQKRRCLAFTRPALLEQLLSEEPPERRESLHLSGIETMRWVHGAPKRIDEIAIDAVPGSEAWLAYPARWMLTAVYPQIAAFDDLDQVARVGLAKIGSLPGARGLKPEVLRSLLTNWREITALAGDEGGPSAPIEHAGGRYRPVFTDHKQYTAFCAAHPDHLGTPQRHGDAAPFAEWLLGAATTDGVVIDPAGPWPLVLDHTDLLVLSLWARDPARRPRSREIVAEAARLRHAGALPAAIVGRIVADWPEWTIGLARGEGSEVEVLRVPLANDVCALFTSPQAADEFLTVHQNLGVFQPPAGMAPQLLTHHWTNSVFHLALRQFSEAWIDPEAMAGAVLVMDRELLAAAAARVEERLRPRVPAFAAGR